MVEVGGFVFWVFWWWFVGCLVVKGVGLALGGGVSELKAMTDSGQSFKQQLLTNKSTNNKSQMFKGKPHLMQHISKYQLNLTFGSPYIRVRPKFT